MSLIFSVFSFSFITKPISVPFFRLSFNSSSSFWMILSISFSSDSSFFYCKYESFSICSTSLYFFCPLCRSLVVLLSHDCYFTLTFLTPRFSLNKFPQDNCQFTLGSLSQFANLWRIFSVTLSLHSSSSFHETGLNRLLLRCNRLNFAQWAKGNHSAPLLQTLQTQSAILQSAPFKTTVLLFYFFITNKLCQKYYHLPTLYILTSTSLAYNWFCCCSCRWWRWKCRPTHADPLF